jgi:hypothetical protein
MKKISIDGMLPTFAWCPIELWNAHKRGDGYRGLSNRFVDSVINGKYREKIAKTLVDNHFQKTFDRLDKAKLHDGIERETAIYNMLVAAATLSRTFIDPFDWEEDNLIKDTATTAKGLMLNLKKLNKYPWPLQALSDKETNFSVSGFSVDTEHLMKSIESSLKELIRICELQTPDVSVIVPKKIKTEKVDEIVILENSRRITSSRTLAIIKARLLRRELEKYYVKPNHQIIADLVLFFESVEVTYDDARKST